MSKTSVPTTLCYLLNDREEVLLILKKRGVGKGRWNGPGGKIQLGESVTKSIIREVEEEVGLRVLDPRLQGVLDFVSEVKPEINFHCYLFVAHRFEGNLQETGEALPRWTKISELPLEQMWDDDRYWLRDLLQGKEVYKLRKQTVERSFADIKHNKKLRSFLLRGVEKVKIEFNLASIAHNIVIIHNLLKRNRAAYC